MGAQFWFQQVQSIGKWNAVKDTLDVYVFSPEIQLFVCLRLFQKTGRWGESRKPSKVAFKLRNRLIQRQQQFYMAQVIYITRRSVLCRTTLRDTRIYPLVWPPFHVDDEWERNTRLHRVATQPLCALCVSVYLPVAQSVMEVILISPDRTIFLPPSVFLRIFLKYPTLLDHQISF